jgi:phage-related protein
MILVAKNICTRHRLQKPIKYKKLYNLSMKNVEFVGSALDDLRGFAISIRRAVGFQIDLVQQGLDPDDWKPMPTVGSGVREIRVRDDTGAYRAIYIAKLADVVYVLHCFQKKTQKTPQHDLDLAKTRLQEVLAQQMIEKTVKVRSSK